MKNICFVLLAALGGLTWAELDLKQLCVDKNLNEILSHPQDCRGYVMCSKEPTAHYCDLGFHFDIKRLVCNWPEEVNCQLIPKTVENVTDTSIIKPVVYTSLMAIDTTSGEILDPMTAYDPQNVVCRHLGAYFLPNPKQCRSYYLCAYGHIHEHACGPNTLWDYRAQQCVLNHEADCFHLAEEEQQEINEILANNIEDDSFVCYPVNTTTETVLPTTPLMPTTTPTPPMSTVWPLSVNSSSKKPNLSNPYNIECPARRQSYVTHPEDCSKYFMCIRGTPVMTSCPEGLMWDSKKEYCDLRQNVKCFQQKF